MSQAAITLIVAAPVNGVIGEDGRLPWHISADLKRFKAADHGQRDGHGPHDVRQPARACFRGGGTSS